MNKRFRTLCWFLRVLDEGTGCAIARIRDAHLLIGRSNPAQFNATQRFFRLPTYSVRLRLRVQKSLREELRIPVQTMGDSLSFHAPKGPFVIRTRLNLLAATREILQMLVNCVCRSSKLPLQLFGDLGSGLVSLPVA